MKTDPTTVFFIQQRQTLLAEIETLLPDEQVYLPIYCTFPATVKYINEKGRLMYAETGKVGFLYPNSIYDNSRMPLESLVEIRDALLARQERFKLDKVK